MLLTSALAGALISATLALWIKGTAKDKKDLMLGLQVIGPLLLVFLLCLITVVFAGVYDVEFGQHFVSLFLSAIVTYALMYAVLSSSSPSTL